MHPIKSPNRNANVASAAPVTGPTTFNSSSRHLSYSIMSPIALATQHAAVLHGPKDLRIEERTLWPPAQGQVQVAVKATGLCGSDCTSSNLITPLRHHSSTFRSALLCSWAKRRLRHALTTRPWPRSSWCGHRCWPRRKGVPHRSTSRHRGWCHVQQLQLLLKWALQFMQKSQVRQQRQDVPPSRWDIARSYEPSCSRAPPVCTTAWLYLWRSLRPRAHDRLPDGCSFDQAALAEPLSVLIHASRRVGLSPSTPSTVLVFGVGAIGLLACALAKASCATRVVAIDINQARLDFAVKQGFAQQAYCLPMSDKAKTTEEQLRRAKENVMAALSTFDMPDGFDIIFECTGAEPCIQMSIHVCVRLTIGMGLLLTRTSINLPGRHHWWEGHVSRHGFAERYFTIIRGRTTRSRHPGVFPLREHIPSCPLAPLIRKTPQHREYHYSSIPHRKDCAGI